MRRPCLRKCRLLRTNPASPAGVPGPGGGPDRAPGDSMHGSEAFPPTAGDVDACCSPRARSPPISERRGTWSPPVAALAGAGGGDTLEPSIYRFILRYSLPDQIYLVVVTLLSFPFLYLLARTAEADHQRGDRRQAFPASSSSASSLARSRIWCCCAACFSCWSWSTAGSNITSTSARGGSASACCAGCATSCSSACCVFRCAISTAPRPARSSR